MLETSTKVLSGPNQSKTKSGTDKSMSNALLVSQLFTIAGKKESVLDNSNDWAFDCCVAVQLSVERDCTWWSVKHVELTNDPCPFVAEMVRSVSFGRVHTYSTPASVHASSSCAAVSFMVETEDSMGLIYWLE